MTEETKEEVQPLTAKEAANKINRVLNVGYESASRSVEMLDDAELMSLTLAGDGNTVKSVLFDCNARHIRAAKEAEKKAEPKPKPEPVQETEPEGSEPVKEEKPKKSTKKAKK